MVPRCIKCQAKKKALQRIRDMQESPAINPETGTIDKSNIFKKPMHVAVLIEDIKAIQSLKISGVKINDVENGQTPLHLAVILCKTLAMQKLISLGANLSKVNKDGFIPLHLAVLNDSVSLIKYLVPKDSESDVDTFDKNGFTALHIAVVLGKVDAVHALLQEGADADLPNKEGTAPLHFALIQGYSDVIDVLLEYVDKPNILNKNELRPLHLAVMYNRIEAISKICQLDTIKINYLNGDGDSALHIATKLGNLRAIEELFESGANMNLKNSKGYCPLHLAVMYNRLNAIETLVRCGARIDCADRLRNTPVHHAVKQNNLPALTSLGRLNANLNLKNAYGDSPLHSAIMAHESKAMRVLLHYGANINILNAKGMAPLHIAVCLGNKDIIENLFRYGASVHSLDAAGNRPIHSAAKLCNSFGIKTLIKFGGRLSSMNRDGSTAVDIVMQYVKKNTFKFAVKTLTDLHKKRNLKRKSPIDIHEILKSAREIFRYDILKNLERTKLNNPEYVCDIIPSLKNYIKDCFAEVKLMKSTYLHENFPFYTFTLFGWHYMMPLTCGYTSDVALNHLLDVSTTKGYPVYRDIIVSKLERSSILKKVSDLRICSRQDGKRIFMDFDAVPLVINHLDNEDIINLLLAFSDLDLDIDITETSKTNKRKLVQSKLGSSSSNAKSRRFCGTRKAQQSVQQKSAKMSRSLPANSSSSSIITRSKVVSNSKTRNGKNVQASEIKSSIKTSKKNCISVHNRLTRTKRASSRTINTKPNRCPLSNKVTRKKYSSSVAETAKKKSSALNTRSKKGKGYSKVFRKNTRSSTSKNRKIYK